MLHISRRAILACSFICLVSPLHCEEISPENLLTSIYKAYLGANATGYNWNDNADCLLAFTPETAKLILDDSKANAGEIGELDFDPFIAAQDFQITDLKISVAPRDETHATASVSFLNFKKPTKMTMNLLKLKAGWRIDDIIWSGKDRGTLKGVFTH